MENRLQSYDGWHQIKDEKNDELKWAAHITVSGYGRVAQFLDYPGSTESDIVSERNLGYFRLLEFVGDENEGIEAIIPNSGFSEGDLALLRQARDEAPEEAVNAAKQVMHGEQQLDLPLEGPATPYEPKL